MTIDELNTRVLIKRYTTTQDEDTGDIDSVLDRTWEKWAKVEQNDGNLLIASGMTNFNESYKITMRYETSRPTNQNYVIEYKGKEMRINNVKRDKEGNIWFEIINAYTTN